MNQRYLSPSVKKAFDILRIISLSREGIENYFPGGVERDWETIRVPSGGMNSNRLPAKGTLVCTQPNVHHDEYLC